MTLLDLPEELICACLSSNGVLGPEDFRVLTLTCRRLYITATPLLYRNVPLHRPIASTIDSMDRFMRTINEIDSRALLVRSIHITWATNCAVHQSDTLRLIESLRNLRHLHISPIFLNFGTDTQLSINCNHPARSSASAPRVERLFRRDVGRLFALPCLRHLRIAGANNIIDFGDPLLPYGCAASTSPVRTLELVGTPTMACGPVFEELLRWPQHLEKLKCITEICFSRSLPSEIHLTLDSVSSTLVELRLLRFCDPLPDPKAKMDFTHFKCLKLLHICSQLLFGAHTNPPTTYRLGVYKCLPSTLESLEVRPRSQFFQCGHLPLLTG